MCVPPRNPCRTAAVIPSTDGIVVCGWLITEPFSRKGPQPKRALHPSLLPQGSHNPTAGQHCPLPQFGTSHSSFRGPSSFVWNLYCNYFRVLTSLSISSYFLHSFTEEHSSIKLLCTDLCLKVCFLGVLIYKKQIL